MVDIGIYLAGLFHGLLFVALYTCNKKEPKPKNKNPLTPSQPCPKDWPFKEWK